LDIKLTKLADSHGAVYSRYADDLIFSSMEHFDRSLARELIRTARRVLQSKRFVLHEQKTSVVPPGARKIVLGLLVDGDRIRINRRMRARLIGHIRGVETFGLSKHVVHSKFASIDGFVRHVSGLLAFVHDIEPLWAAEMQHRWQTALRANKWTDLPLFWSNERY
jgi:RNA-directed DNA polymerase